MVSKTEGSPTPYLCARCHDSGHEVIELAGNKSAVQRCTADPCPYLSAKYGIALGVPAQERDAALERIARVPSTREHVGNEAAIQHAKFFADGTHHGLYIYGLPGRGKTTLACATLNACMKRRTTSRFVRTPELLIRLIQDDDSLFDELVATPVLCLDDVGASQGTDYARRTLQALFDAREDRQHRTIWTSNLTLGELSEFLQDDRLSSRIAGACKIIEVGGPDHRLAGPKPRAKQIAGPPARKHW